MSKSLKIRRLAFLAAVAGVAVAVPAAGQVALNSMTWVGPDGGNWSEGSNWLDQSNNPTVPGATSTVRILKPMSGAGVVYTASPLISSTVLRLEVGAGSALSITSGSQLVVLGLVPGGPTVTNAGLIRLQGGSGPGAGQFTELQVGQSLFELSGGGVIELGGYQSGIGLPAGFSSVLRVLDATVRGAGQVGRGVYTIENHGVIVADRPGEVLEVRPSFFLGSFTGLRNFATGRIGAEGGGRLVLRGGLGRFDLSQGTVSSVGAGSVISMRENAVIEGGVLMTSGGGVFRVDAGQTVTWLGTGVGTGAVVQVADGGTLFGGSTPGEPNRIVNHGQIVLGSPEDTVGASLRPNGGGASSLILSGTGALVLNSDRAAVGPAFLGGVVTNSSGHTVRGFGTFTGGFIGLDNEPGATVSADVAGQTLRLRPVSGGITNAGVLEARGGGTLRLTSEFGGQQVGGPVNQAATGVVRAVGAGSLVEISDGTTIVGGNLHTESGGLVRFGSAVGSNQGGLTDVTSTADVEVGPRTSLIVGGSLVNHGRITLKAPDTSATTSMLLQQGAVLSGTGEVMLRRGPAGTTLFGNASFANVATHESGHTIRGSGQMNLVGTFTNRGTVRAEGPGELILVNVIGGGSILAHTGLMEAVDGATLSLVGPVDSTGGGVIRASGTGSVVTLPHQSTLTGGTLAGVDGGVVRMPAGFSTSPIFEGVRLVGEVEVLANASIRAGGAFTNDSRLTLRSMGTGPASIGLFTGDTVVDGSGEIVLDSSAATTDGGRATIGNTFAGGLGTNGRLVNEAGHTVRGAGVIQSRLLNRGLVHADAGPAIHLAPLNLPDTIINEGTFRASNGANLIAHRTPSNFEAGRLAGGVWEVGPGSAIRLAGVNISVNAATIRLTGPGSDLLNATTGTTSALAPLHTNEGTLVIEGGRNLTTVGTLSNEGLLVVGAGSTLTVNGSLDNGGKVSGKGNIITQRLRVNGGRLAPGASPGVLTVTGDLEFGTGSVYEFEIGLDESDRVDVNGDLIFGTSATVDVSLFDTDAVVGGDYVLFTTTGRIIGSPQWTVVLPGLLTSEGVGIQGQTVVLRGVAVVPEPAAVGLLMLGLPLLSRPRW